MPRSTPSSLRLAVSGLLALGALASARGDNRARMPDPRMQVRALAPVDVVASGFEELSAVAVDPAGTLLVTDRAAGTLTRIGEAGDRQTLLNNLQGPSGLAIDGAGNILVIEAAGRRILRINRDGLITTVASGLRQPRSIAVGPDGQVWIATRAAMGQGGDEDDRRGASPASEYVIARLEDSGTLTRVASGFMGVEGLAAGGGALYVAMARLAAERGRMRTTVARIPIRADGTAAAEPVLSTTLRRALGVGIDAAGGLFVSGRAADDDDDSDVIVKKYNGGEVAVFATGLKRPVALAFGPHRDLVAVDQRESGRVLRFRAPSAPVPEAPAFTNQSSLVIRGRSGARDRIDVFQAAEPAFPLETTIADAQSGDFTVRVPLAPNSYTDLSFVATAAAGAGLVSLPAGAHILHDDHLPIVTISEPFPGAYVRDMATLRARGEDEGSGIASITFMLDEDVVATVENDDPPAPLIGSAALDVRRVPEGAHAVTVAAMDRAGNTAAAAQLLVVDRTPPDTHILSDPGPDTAERTVTFGVGGIDVQSPALEFSWRLDEGAWAPYGRAATIVVSDLTPGPHRFEVRARDLAGNEDPTAAAHTFTVIALRVRIVEPASGALITTETVWVRGTIDRAGPVEITIPLPEEFRQELSVDSLWVPAIAGTFAVVVPVARGTTALTVTARDAQGNSASESIDVTVQLPLGAPTAGFDVFPAAGLAPHTVRFGAPTFPAGAFSLDLESDATVDYEGDGLESREFTYARPGAYVATLRVTTQDGQTFTGRTSVEVYDRAALEAQLQAAWGGLKEALRTRDVQRAATFVHSGRRAAWQEYLSQLPASAFEAIDSVFTEVTLLDMAPGRAECQMMREVGGVVYSFPVSFLIDADGRWRLWQF
jgi:glucose/arabinose dehydrogenase